MTEVECFDPLTSEWTECHPQPEQIRGRGRHHLNWRHINLDFSLVLFLISLANPGPRPERWSIIHGGLGPEVGGLTLSSWASTPHFRDPREQMPLGCSNVRLTLLTLWPVSGFNYTVDLISKHTSRPTSESSSKELNWQARLGTCH